ASKFREDLFFRLRVVEISLPPLRERPEDIPLLAQAFLQEFASQNNKAVNNFTPDALDCLTRYTWPGNVRELRTAIEHAVVFSRSGKITARDLPHWVRNASGGAPAGQEQCTLTSGNLTVKEAEKQLMMQALKDTKGKRT